MLTGLWLVSLAIGFGLVIDYDARPGRAADGTPRWPTDSQLQLAPSGKTLVMFLHPHCACSSASLEELDHLVHEQPGPAKLYIVVAHLPIDDPDQATPTMTRAAAIPGSELVGDQAGLESQRFGSHTSGTLLVFNADGQRVYSGGLTQGRGHVGPNKALDAAAAAVRDRPTADAMPVFGCPLF
ncbi:MAG: hypothetical protein WD845_16135 [Pirellulales bacterium]